MKKIFYIIGLSLFPLVARAEGNLSNATSRLGEVGIKSGANSYSDLPTIIGTGINVALSLVGLIFLILMIYAGYLWMTAQGAEEQVTKAKDIIKSTMIGLVVLVSGYAITTLVILAFK